jgi:hypothetical protein
VAETTSFLHGRGFESQDEAADAAREFVEFCRDRMWVVTDVGTTADGERLYAFTHRTFLEYFAASRLASVSDTPEDLARALAPHLALEQWQVVGELAFQLKEHASDQGADRFCAEMLKIAWQPYYDGKQRAALLGFAARCPRSGHLSPATIRSLTGSVLDNLFDDQPGREPWWWYPLNWLLCNDEQQDLIADEISRRAGVMAGSDDPAAQLDAARLAFALGEDFVFPQTERTARQAQRRISFWRQWSDSQKRALAPIIEFAAAEDNAIRVLALLDGLISPDRALTMPGGPGALMRTSMLAPFGVVFLPCLPDFCRMLLGYMPERSTPSADHWRQLALGQFAALGRYLQHHQPPPWAEDLAKVSGWRYQLGLESRHRPLPLDEVSYLGAAAAILMTAEFTEVRLEAPEPPGDAGPLSLLAPYLDRRGGTPGADVPDLPVPVEFRQLFRDWADGKVSFTSGVQGTGS